MSTRTTIQGMALATCLTAGLWGLPAAHAARTPEVPEQGQRLFQVHCAGCHGNEGRGDGPVTSRHNWSMLDAEDLSRKPRDLTRDWFQFGDEKADIMRTIRNGSAATAMDSFTPRLADDEVALLADTVLALRGNMSNDLILRRYPERILPRPVTPHHHRLPNPAIQP